MMKKVLAIIFLSMMILMSFASLVNANEQGMAIETQVEVIQHNKVTQFFKGLFGQGLYISGGSFTADEVEKGNLVDASIDFRFKNNAPNGHSVELWWLNTNTNAIVRLGKWNMNAAQKPNDWITVNFKNLKTEIIPDSWCGDYIKLAGIHYITPSFGLSPVVDFIGSADDKRPISDNILLTCQGAECNKQAKSPICNPTGVGGKVVQEVVNFNTCTYQFTTIRQCSSNEKCIGSACVPITTGDTCQKYKNVCQTKNTVVTICETDNSDFTIRNCASGTECKDGVCITPTTPPEETVQIWYIEDNTCKGMRLPESSITENAYRSLSACEANLSNDDDIVQDREIVVWVINREMCVPVKMSESETNPNAYSSKQNCESALNSGSKSFCELNPSHSLCTSNGGTEIQINPELIVDDSWHKGLLDYKNNTFIAVLLTLGAIIILIMSIYLLVPQKTWMRLFK
jgi:hypothetical protein